MPTKLYTTKTGGTVGHGGKEYPIVEGAVDVPDEAVPALVESHGFTKTPAKDAPEAPAWPMPPASYFVERIPPPPKELVTCRMLPLA